jgi:hypothetical protein
MKHLTTAELADHLDGRAASQVGRRVVEHLAGCPDCSAAFSRLEQMMGVMRADRSPEPPASILARTIALFDREPARSAPELMPWLSGLRQVLGRLVFDSLADPAFAGARGARGGVARRLRFEAQGCELDLAVERRQGRFRLLGQVAQTSGSATKTLVATPVRLFLGQEQVVETTTDDLGEFACQVSTLENMTLAVLVPPEAVIFALPAGTAGD